MNEIKEQFKDWLLKQGLAERTKSGNPSTVYDYIKSINKVCLKFFNSDEKKVWQELSENIYPVLVKYFELSNKEYFFDAISIQYGLFYLREITNFIYSRLKEEDIADDVSLYLNFNEQNYPICTIKLRDLFQYTLLFDSLVYEHNQSGITLSRKQREEFLSHLDDMIHNSILPSIGKFKALKHHVMLRISYPQCSKKEKTALIKYYNYINPGQNVLTLPMVEMVRKNNPNNKVGGNYIITCNISGKHPLQLDLDPHGNLESYDDNADKHMTDEDERCILIKEDMPKIFNVAYNSIDEIISKGRFKTFQAPKRIYYNIDSVNSFLQKNFHPLKDENKHKKVNYDETGYEFWCGRSYALKEFLKISHNRFYDCVHRGNCTQLDYLESKPKYYIPDIKCLRQSFKVKQARISIKKYKK